MVIRKIIKNLKINVVLGLATALFHLNTQAGEFYLPSSPTPVVINDNGLERPTETRASRNQRVLDELVREISKYDIVHFGERHYYGDGEETSTIEDFRDYFLPRLADKRLVGKPYRALRLEYLPHEDYSFSDEWEYFDKTGKLCNDKTKLIIAELESHFGMGGVKETAEMAYSLGFRVRGVNIPAVLCINTLVSAKSREEGSLEVIRTISKKCVEAVRADMKTFDRLILYGGANHNDRDNRGIGIAREIEKEFPGRYCAVDLRKPCLFKDKDNSKGTSKLDLETLRQAGFSAENLDKVVVVPLENDFRANYIVFLPERRFMVEDAGK